jgi:hypothetical protein
MSMCICSRHGATHSRLASPDLFAAVAGWQTLPPHRLVTYEYLGRTAEWMLLSLEYIERENIDDSSPMELPDDYPAWFMRLGPACSKCLKELTAQPPAP